MDTTISIEQWLNTEPDASEIRDRDGAKYIPYHIVVQKLNDMCMGLWSTRNFRHLMYTLKNGTTICSGHVDVVVNYAPFGTGNMFERVLSGAATIVLSRASNPHVAATVKSLAVMNAVKPLGKQFGWGINGFENDVEPDYFPQEDLPTIQQNRKMKPDNAIMKQYLKAVEDKDQIKIDQLTMMYDIKTD